MNFKNHPGTPSLILFVVSGALAGLSRYDDPEASAWWPLYGALIMLAFITPFYLYGARERSDD